ncbi:MAG TPA: hypothetical protein ENI15_08685 [Spirochaetes bacterium]|nr:hypothetical protein [Spirochaetota bacterium]
MCSSNRKIFLKAVVILTSILAFSHASAQNYEIEKYLNYYDLELERLISHSEYARDYEKFRSMLEIRYNVLKAVWESDRDRLKEIARETGDKEEAVDDLDRKYDEWEKRSEKRISRSKAEYIAGQSAPDTGEMEVTRLELIFLFSEKYEEFVTELTGESHELTDGELFQDFKSGLISGYREKAQKLDNLSDLQYEALKLELKGSYQGEGIEAEHFDEALEREKRGMLYERKLFLTQLLNTYVNRGYRDLVTDRSSLRMEMEKDRAARAAEELQDRVNQELDKSISEKLNSLLREEVLTAEDAFAISGKAKDVYDEGLNIWERAAADLVRRENAWYSNYNEIYNEGVTAWADALSVLKQKREEWDEEFSGRIESGLANWEEVFSEAGEAKETLVSNYVRYKEDRERDLNSYIGRLEDTLMYGSGSISQIDRYTDEFNMMIQDSLRYFTDKELAPNQLDGLVELFSSYKGKEASFWQPDMDMSNLFDFRTKDLRVWIFFRKRKINSRRDKIVDGPRYDLISKEDLTNGFQLKVRLGATIRRYGEWHLDILDGFWTINSNDIRENKYYYVTCTYDKNGRWSRKVTLENSEAGSFSKIVSELPVARIADALGRYSNIIGSLNRDKKEIIDSVRDVQGSIVRMLDENLNVLDGPVFQNEEEFEEYFFGPENEFLWGDFDRALYKAYYEKEFWGPTSSI